MTFDTNRLQGLCRSLDILIHMKEGIKEFGLECGNECYGNGSYTLSVVVMPWEGDEIIPDKLTVFSKIFQFYQEIWENQLDVLNERFDDKIPFHLVDHLREENKRLSPCLNSVFGRAGTYFWTEHEYDYERELAFFTWLQNIMVPSRLYIAGYGKMSPAPLFFITSLAPGWVGGILTCEFAD